ncbi:hypothetical protein K438DRAFT_1767383 [Mycena galopus ATCC 62051]|nr:hypothetical protein K438DRAFT_1767383 [Mycena galopus ATCC 62051]
MHRLSQIKKSLGCRRPLCTSPMNFSKVVAKLVEALLRFRSILSHGIQFGYYPERRDMPSIARGCNPLGISRNLSHYFWIVGWAVSPQFEFKLFDRLVWAPHLPAKFWPSNGCKYIRSEGRFLTEKWEEQAYSFYILDVLRPTAQVTQKMLVRGLKRVDIGHHGDIFETTRLPRA